MKNFEIEKVQPEGVAYLELSFLPNFSLALLINVLLIKKARSCYMISNVAGSFCFWYNLNSNCWSYILIFQYYGSFVKFAWFPSFHFGYGVQNENQNITGNLCSQALSNVFLFMFFFNVRWCYYFARLIFPWVLWFWRHLWFPNFGPALYVTPFL